MNDSASDSHQPRERLLVRQAKALSIAVVAAVLCGLVYGYSDYWRQFTERSRLKREMAEERIKEDSLGAANRRFLLGGALGACLGAIYIVRRTRQRKEL